MINTQTRAVAIAKTHVEAWDRHDWDASRKLLTKDVRVTTSTTQPIMAPVDTTGDDLYMEGLIRFAQAVVPGSTRVLASTGDEHNAMLLIVSDAAFGGRTAPLIGSRLYQIDDSGKIKFEQVIFYIAES